MDGVTLFSKDLNVFLSASGIGLWYYSASRKAVILDEVAQGIVSAVSESVPVLEFLQHVTTQPASLLLQEIEEKKTLTALLYINNSNVILKGQFMESEGWYGGTIQRETCFAAYSAKHDIFRSIIEQAPVATALFTGPEMRIEIANSIMLDYWGKGASVFGKPLAEALPELEGQPFLDILDHVFTTGETHEETEAMAQLVVNGVLGTYYFDYTYKALKDANGTIYGVMDMAIDVTERVLSKHREQNSEIRFANVIEQSPMAIGFLSGREMKIEVANETILRLWSRDESVIGKNLKDVLPEIDAQGFLKLLDDVYTTGVTFKGTDTHAQILNNGVVTDIYVDFSYSALRDNNGEIYGILVLANDVSEKMQAIREIAASEAKFKSVIYSAQAAVAVFVGEDLVADIVNDEFLRFVGRTREQMVGKPLLQSMPEIKGQASEHLMLEVIKSGVKTHHFGRQVNIVKNGVLTQNFYNVSYSPLYDAEGQIYGVLDIAIDVTETIKAQEALKETEAALRGAIELAELGTWSLNPVTEVFEYSERVKEWLGLDGEEELFDESLDVLHKVDRERIRTAVYKSINPESDGFFNEEFRVISRKTGTERILHAVGKTFFDENGLPYLLTGTAQDITAIKKIQIALENQVRERTNALQRANQELENINQKLVNTNRELEQYAYVASHDLQEPLRKISMFSNLLKERDTDNQHTVIIDKIVTASQRMSLLIKDLLEFSRLVSPDTRFLKTDLNEIVKLVQSDFELLIQEKNAAIISADLPVIDAVPLQMNQLFYNLIGNALKFTNSGQNPVVSLSVSKLSRQEIAIYIKNPLPSSYYKISIKDNGIGIEEQYQKQIFEVFKRLHSRSEYAGSGIGLAICRRIVNNHGGVILVESSKGMGTTFNILLPEHQL